MTSTYSGIFSPCVIISDWCASKSKHFSENCIAESKTIWRSAYDQDISPCMSSLPCPSSMHGREEQAQLEVGQYNARTLFCLRRGKRLLFSE
jgi:hypothetical protein